MSALFVYGLLKPGFSLWHVAEPFVTAADPGWTRGRLYDAGVPAARFDREGRIEGFVLRLDPARSEQAFAVLDDVEDEGEEYRRVLVPVTTTDGTSTAHAYEYLGAVDRLRDVGRTWPLGPAPSRRVPGATA